MLRVEPSVDIGGVHAVEVELQIKRVGLVQQKIGTGEDRGGIAVAYDLPLQRRQAGGNTVPGACDSNCVQ